GLGTRFHRFVLGNFSWFWWLVGVIPPVANFVNTYIINAAVKRTRNRPHSFSARNAYTSWASLTDRTYFGRHLAPEKITAPQNDVADIVEAFRRSEGAGQTCPKSTLLFPVFAQYLTDGFLRTKAGHPARTTSNHEIDLSPLYGRTEDQTNALRLKSELPGEKGRLLSQEQKNEEYPPFLYLEDGKTIDPRFLDASGELILDPPLGLSNHVGQGRERMIFAVGGDRANATPMVTALNTLLLREHNRLAGELEKQQSEWNDERVFQTARNILIVIYIKLVVEEYINHISSIPFRLRANPKVAWKADWNRPNWMTIEFALLYRWHPLVPSAVSWNGRQIDSKTLVLDNRLAVETGLARSFEEISANNAMQLTLFNTPDFLLETERNAIQQGRDLQVATYNQYRDAMGLPVVTDFNQMTADPNKIQALEQLYGDPDLVEYYFGLFAEDTNPNTPMPTLMGVMVALDAFSQALTNPLMSEHVYNAATFTEWGLKEIKRTKRLSHLVARTTSTDVSKSITMTRSDWKGRMARF
ncbi:MAG: peroxidase family protein, partial [Cyanobacteria bacterium J06633_2]